MARVLILVEDPPALAAGDLDDWFGSHARRLAAATSVTHAGVYRLGEASTGPANWLLELEGPDAGAIEKEPALADLLSGLREKGAHPQVLVVPEGGA